MGLDSLTGVATGLGVNVPREAILRRLTITPAGFDSAGRMAELFDATVSRGYRLAEASAVWKTMEVLGCDATGVSFAGTTFRIGSVDVAVLLRPCRRATLMAATVGGKLSIEAEKLMAAKKMTEAMVLDAFSSEAVEAVTDELCDHLVKSSAGTRPTRRFSPGYGDWALAAQGEILRELAAERIGVSVSEQCILRPEKTITAIIGW